MEAICSGNPPKDPATKIANIINLPNSSAEILPSIFASTIKNKIKNTAPKTQVITNAKKEPLKTPYLNPNIFISCVFLV